MPNFQVFLLMTISNHVNFEKLLLNIFDTKYKSRNGGGCTGMECSKQENIWADIVLKEQIPTTEVKDRHR